LASKLALRRIPPFGAAVLPEVSCKTATSASAATSGLNAHARDFAVGAGQRAAVWLGKQHSDLLRKGGFGGNGRRAAIADHAAHVSP
jgi:hypothetical protein